MLAISERPNQLKLSSAEPRSFGHFHRSFGRSFGRISTKRRVRITQKLRIFHQKFDKTKYAYLHLCNILVVLFGCNLQYLAWYNWAEKSSKQYRKMSFKIVRNSPKMTFFADSVVRQSSPKLRPNYFGRKWPKLRPKLRFRSFTTSNQIGPKNYSHHHYAK